MKTGSKTSLSVKNSNDFYVCDICSKKFYKKILLNEHIRTHNSNLKDGKIDTDAQHTCKICCKKFTAKKNLLKHLRDIHKNFTEAEKMVVKKIKCPERNCEFLCRLMKDLRNHIETCHNIKILKDTLQFSNETLFQEWKKDEETNTVSWFITGRKKSVLMNGTTKQILYCHRTGHYIPKGFGKYRRRTVGSCKIGVTCPAAMEVSESVTGEVTVVYYKTHLGHQQDVVYLKLSKEERTNLGEKIKQGFSFNAILEDMKEAQNSQEKKKRIHLLSKKDLYSIKRSESCSSKKQKSCEELELEQNEKKDENYSVVVANDGGDSSKAVFYEEQRLISGVPTEGIPSGIVILPPDIDYTSVAEIIFLSHNDNAFQPFNPLKINSTVNTTSTVGEIIPENKTKINKSHLQIQLRKKLEKIMELLPQADYLTPRQFESVNTKLDLVLDIFGVASEKANARRKSLRGRRVKNEKKKGGSEGVVCDGETNSKENNC